MNKTLIAMAVAGLMAAPMAAQANATIYGKIHVSIDVGDTGLDDGPNGELGSSIYFQNNSSRLGFKGSEDLGGGLKAIWQFETNIDLGSATGQQFRFGGRNTYVGLNGGWGTFLAGRHDSPMKTTGRKFDLFGDYVGDSRNLIAGVVRGVDSNGDVALNLGFDPRLDNALMYKTPVFGGGWDITALYTLEDANKNSEVLAANINWKTGNWYSSLAYQSNGSGRNTFDGGTEDETGIRFGVYWTPGAWKLTALYETLSDLNGVSGQDSDVYGLGAAYKMGKNVLKAQYYVTSNSEPGGASDIDSALMAIGWDYNFSKRTTGYLAYAATSNDANIYNAVDAGGHGGEMAITALGSTTPMDGKDPSVFSVGVIHKF